MTNTPRIDLADSDAVCASLGLSGAPDIWRRTWPQSAASFAPRKTFFLRPEYVGETCKTLRNSPEVAKALHEAAAQIAQNAALERLAWHCHWLVCRSGLDPRLSDWPEIPAEVEPAGPMLTGVIVLSGWPRLREIHQARNIDIEDTIETLSDLETWLQDFKRWGGYWRFARLGWLIHHLRGELFKLGRLEYLPGSYYHPFRFYRHVYTGKVLALAEDGALFRSDGQFASADHGEVRDGLWKSRLEVTCRSVCGNPISPEGAALPRVVVLDTAEWHEVLRPGDPVMTVHIPSKDPMTPQACGASFRRAVEFHRQHFPDAVYRAFTCESWLLAAQFDLLDPVPANIAAFAREWYLHPAEGASDSQTWERVFDLFGGSRPDPDNAPQDTSLRRAIVAFMRQGHHLRGGGGVIFPEDLDWGQEVYRREKRAEETR